MIESDPEEKRNHGGTENAISKPNPTTIDVSPWFLYRQPTTES
jgi:hypothetical protein